MDDATKFLRIFGGHQGRATYAGRLHIRDAGTISELKARLSGLAARDNRARNSGWLIDFTPTQTDDLTERSLFDAVLTSTTRGERRIRVRVGRDWIELGGGAMQSSVRNDPRNIDMALDSAFHRVVLRGASGPVDSAAA